MPLFKPKRIVTLDIGYSSIKLAEFLIQKKQPILDNFTVFPLPENCIHQEDLEFIELLKEPLSAFISEHTLYDVRNVHIALGGRSVFVKKIETSRAEQELLDDIVQVEVKQNLPFNEDEINYNYSIINNPAHPEPDKLNILLIVAMRDAVSAYDTLFQDMGYKCKTVDMHGFALASCFKFAYPEAARQKDTNIVLLDVGRLGTNFIVLHQGELIFNRYMMIGSNYYIENIMQEMSVDLQEAESLYLSSGEGEEKPEEINRIIAESSQHFCNEIQQGSRYFKNQFPEQTIMECYVTGGGAKLGSLVSSIGQTLNIPTQVFNPFMKLRCSEVLNDSVNHIKYFAPVSAGLCLRGM